MAITSLTGAEIQELMVEILGKTVENAPFTSSGAPAKRNALLTTEKVITKLLNAFSNNIVTNTNAVNGFANRINTVIGDEATNEKDAFEALGGNLINVITSVKATIEDPEFGGNNFSLTEAQQDAVDSGITATILATIQSDIAAKLNAADINILTNEEIETLFDEVFEEVV
jgi:hypothetical protein